VKTGAVYERDASLSSLTARRGPLLVFRVDDRAIVERFVREDPCVRGGTVRAWRVRPWTVVIGGEDQPDAAKTGT